MSTLSEKLASSMDAIGGSAKEWPAYVILREILPARLRILVAAVMAQELESDSGFAELLLSCADNESAVGACLVDDLVLRPPRREHADSRELVRSWLRGVDSDYFSMINAKMHAGVEIAPSILKLGEIGDIRWLTIPSVTSKHARQGFTDPLLSKIANSYSMLLAFLSQPQHPSESLILPEGSNLLNVLWLKHCGDQSYLAGRIDIAANAYQNATTQSSRLKPSPIADQILLSLKLSILATRGLEQGPDAVLPEVERLRKEFAGKPSADLVDSLAWNLRWEIANAEGTIKDPHPAPPLYCETYEGISHLLRLRDRMYSQVSTGQLNECETTYSVATQTSLALGAFSFVSELREAHVHELFARDPLPIRAALSEMILSGRHNAVSPLKRLRPNQASEVVGQLDSAFLKTLEELANTPPSQRTARRTVLAEALSELASFRGYKDEVFLSILDTLFRLASEERLGANSNTNTITLALTGIERLYMLRPRFLVDARAKALTEALVSTLAVNAPWFTWEKTLGLARSCVSDLDNSARGRLINQVLEMFEKSLTPEGGDWPLVRAGFNFLLQHAVLQQLKVTPDLLTRAKNQVTRHCFSGQGTEFSAGWEYGLAMARVLEMSPLPDEGRQLIDMHLRHAQQSNSSNAAAAVRRIVRLYDILSRDELSRFVDALTGIVNWRSSTGGASPASPDAALAVHDVANLWRKTDQQDDDDLKQACYRLFDACHAFINDGAQKPILFAPFSIPRRDQADPNLVAYWVSAILTLGEALSRSKDAHQAVAQLREAQPVLGEPIARALADVTTFGNPAVEETRLRINAEALRKIDQAELYATLGNILAQIANTKDQEVLLALLVSRCIEWGPRTEDLGVFAMAVAYPALHSTISTNSIERYQVRFRSRRSEAESESFTVVSRLLEILRSKTESPGGGA
ncbi:hypothetical protein ACIHQR_11015 [Corallococcus coralloides]|uniref:hypothetical protein n=1 Tax=Corallococcus coralloides TaxID=184914 RepID=UPI00384BABA2